MDRFAIWRGFTRVAASVAMILAAFMSFGAALLVNADPAHAAGGSVSSPSVTLSTSAADATNVTYTISFTTSPTGSLAPDTGTITLAAPGGTVFNSNDDYTVEDVTTGTQCGLENSITSNGGDTTTLTVGGGCSSIAAGDAVLVTASAVSNPSTTSTGDAVTVATSSDTTVVSSNTYAITAAEAVTSPTVTLSTIAAGATNVSYDVRFNTSSTGALESNYSTVTLTLPAGAVFTSGSSFTIADVTTGTNCGAYNVQTSNGGATVTLTDGCTTIAGGDTVLVTASAVSNPATTSSGDAVAVSTSSDTLSAQTNTYAITAAKAVASTLLTLSTTEAGATDVSYTTAFTTSSTGGLAPYYSTITLAAAAGTVFSSSGYYTIEDVTTATQCGLNNWVTSDGGAMVTLTVAGGCTIAAGHTVLVTASQVSNPATTSSGDTVTVSTSSDTLSAQTNTYAITAAKAVSSPSVILSSTTAGATNVTYSTSFTTSSTGALAPSYSTITLNAPTGTVFGTDSSYTIEDVTTGAQCSGYSAGTSNNGATVTLSDNSNCGTIAGGHAVLVTATGVSNPGTAATGQSLTVSTSSDTLSAQTNTYAITAAQAVSSPLITLTTTAAGATNVTYDVRFTTSPTGALAPYYSTITLNAPTGTDFTADSTYTIYDVTTGTNCGFGNLGHEQRRSHRDREPLRLLRHHCRRRHGAGHRHRGLQPGIDLHGERGDRLDLVGHALGPDQHLRHDGGQGGVLAADHTLDDGGRCHERHLHRLVHHLVHGSAGAVLLDDHPGCSDGDKLRLELVHDRRPHDGDELRPGKLGHEQQRRHRNGEPVLLLRHHRRWRRSARDGERRHQPGNGHDR